MAERYLLIPSPLVKKSNALARATWSVKSIYEPRLIALVASRVRVDDLDFCTYEIPVSEVLGAASDGRTRKLLSEVVEGLLGRILTIPMPDGWAKCSVFSWCEFDSKSGIIRARFDPGLKPHYLGLQNQFTQYSLFEFLLLPSMYSQRLFEILKSWCSLPEVVINLADIFQMLDVPVSLRRYPDFRRYVLEKAHKDILGRTSLRYSWCPVKQGRAVAAIRFSFGPRSSVAEKSAQAKKRTSDNSLLLRAVSCFKSGSCSPKPSKLCDLCLRLVKPSGG